MLIQGEFELDFDLLWEGPLPSDQGNGVSPKVGTKQAMRCHFNYQLLKLFDVFSTRPAPPHVLNVGIEQYCAGEMRNGRLVPKAGTKPVRSGPNELCYIEVGGQKYQAMVKATAGVVCHLDITILSPPGATARRDTDNRVKVIRDALRIPHTEDEVKGSETKTPDPCLCLLEDDGGELVGQINAITRPLLKPPMPGREQEVAVWIKVRIVTRGDAGF